MDTNHRAALLQEIHDKLPRLTTGDLHRLDQFAASMLEQKAGKRQQRAKRKAGKIVSFAVLGD